MLFASNFNFSSLMLLFPHCFLSCSFLLKFFWCHQWFFLSYYFFLSIYGKKSWMYTTKDIYQPCTMPEKYFCKFFVVQFSVTIFITQLNHTKSNKQKTENISLPQKPSQSFSLETCLRLSSFWTLSCWWTHLYFYQRF